ncbi:ATP-dependent RecD-like DNA helicase [Sporosarcina sp. Marseille-Q4063]|uniref:SF1B family DNA helicase RecD2 n=1 Tax=Sporosarcina sp. Marseille-Q4063 TaxID=2810514 RepID=UPI001BAF1416|nr:ATP-dependent RecD-like DNA helicase [Sporosarcina sp. Marseille-Q4063]QUW20885.1 ATP-dependent RecD-like DNA helicase [Sporosarcina sp. Marseille-Q4063]
MNEFKGKVVRVLYRNEDFLIAKLQTDKEELTIKGSIYGVDKGEEIKVRGAWENHAKFGKQLAVEFWERPIPQTKDQVIAFLASSLVKGCGPKQSTMIAEKLGENALMIITQQGETSLQGIKGIGKKRANNIVESIRSTFEVQKIIAELLVFGITASMAMRLYKEYGSNTVAIVTKNPYKLTELNLIGFLKADEIAQKMGISPLSGYRIDACVNYVLKEKCFTSGHCYITEESLLAEAARSLNHNTLDENKVSMDELAQSIYRLEEKHIVIEDNFVYPKFLFTYEDRLARKLSEMRGSRDGVALPSLDKQILKYQKKRGIILAEKQREAVRRLFEEQMLILTGGPGTGKTTVIRAMLDMYKEMHPEDIICLAAPTGKASRQLSEVAGHVASTIHRLIGYQQGEIPTYNWQDKLPCDLLVVDEMSMVDVQLASLLLDALERDTKILFVGDRDQLPSVSPGNVLSDLIQSGLPTVALTEVFRQAQESQIISNAHRVNQGKSLLIDSDKGDFYFINQENPKGIAALIVKSALRFQELGYSISDILILSPMKKGPAGTLALNEQLRDALNPAESTKNEWEIGKRLFRLGDKVIQIKNNQSKGVFNGDIGVITNISKEVNKDNEIVEKMTCDFMGVKVSYEKSETNELELGYAITIHKSQGGEAPIVIIPATTSHYVMLARNLMYTGMTRAKERIVLIGTQKAMEIAIGNNKLTERNSGLSDRITSYTEYNNRFSREDASGGRG